MDVLTLLAAATPSGSDTEPASNLAQLASALSGIAEVCIRYVSLTGMLMVAFCILASLYRILKGPTLTDRILASDALSLFVVALVLLLGELLQTAVFYDAALMVAILGFVATIAMSRFLLAYKAPQDEDAQAQPQAADPAPKPAQEGA